MMLKYVKTCQNDPPYLAGDATGYSRPLSYPFQTDFRVSSFVAVGAPRRFVSILVLISSALAYTDSEMKRNRTLFSCLERKCIQCGPRDVLDHFFNVHLGVSGRATV